MLHNEIIVKIHVEFVKERHVLGISKKRQCNFQERRSYQDQQIQPHINVLSDGGGRGGQGGKGGQLWHHIPRMQARTSSANDACIQINGHM